MKKKVDQSSPSLHSLSPPLSLSLSPSDKKLKLIPAVIVKASSGPRYVVGCRPRLLAQGGGKGLSPGTRVTLDMTTLTIMRSLKREVDPVVHNMAAEDPGKVDYSSIGGLGEQVRNWMFFRVPLVFKIFLFSRPLLTTNFFSSTKKLYRTQQIREIRESIELPLLNPEIFERVGIKPPKGVLLYGPPGTGKTLLARAIAANMDANFLKVVASAIVDKYIGESARLIREMFGYARDHQPCIIFMDEVRRFEVKG